MRDKYTKTWYIVGAITRRELRTATEIWSRVKFNFDCMPSKPPITLATVSGILNRLVKRGDVQRIKGFGPRGGYGYVITKKAHAKHQGWQ